jgi:hypothetical protein
MIRNVDTGISIAANPRKCRRNFHLFSEIGKLAAKIVRIRSTLKDSSVEKFRKCCIGMSYLENREQRENAAPVSHWPIS